MNRIPSLQPKTSLFLSPKVEVGPTYLWVSGKSTVRYLFGLTSQFSGPEVRTGTH